MLEIEEQNKLFPMAKNLVREVFSSQKQAEWVLDFTFSEEEYYFLQVRHMRYIKEKKVQKKTEAETLGISEEDLVKIKKQSKKINQDIEKRKERAGLQKAGKLEVLKCEVGFFCSKNGDSADWMRKKLGIGENSRFDPALGKKVDNFNLVNSNIVESIKKDFLEGQSEYRNIEVGPLFPFLYMRIN